MEIPLRRLRFPLSTLSFGRKDSDMACNVRLLRTPFTWGPSGNSFSSSCRKQVLVSPLACLKKSFFHLHFLKHVFSTCTTQLRCLPLAFLTGNVSCAWRSLSFLDLWVIVFIKFGKFLSITSSNILFSAPLPLSFGNSTNLY